MPKKGSEISSLNKYDDSIKEELKDDISEISLKSYKTGPLKSVAKAEPDPRSKSEEKISSRTKDTGKKTEKVDRKSMDITTVTDGFESTGDTEKGKVKSLESVTIGDSTRSRKASVSSIIKDGVGKATRFLRTLTVKTKAMRRQSSTIIFLGNRGASITNTGFAFSQDSGVSSAITTSPDR